MPFIYDRLSLKGKVAVVTGAGQGIGKGIALGLAEVGARMCIAEMNEETGPATAREISSAGGESFAFRADVREAVQVNALMKAVTDRWGRIDVLVNNAGGTFFIPALDISPNGFDAVVRENLKTMFLCSQAAARAMIQGGHGGSIVNIASMNAFIAGANLSVYSAAKAGVAGMTRALAWEWGKHGIRVNAIAPGSIETEGTRGRGTDRDWSILPVGRKGQPADIACAAVFLASDLGGYVTGETLLVDGGAVIRAM